MRIEILPDYHGVPEAVERDVGFLKEIAKETPPDKTVIFHEAIPSDLDIYAAALTEGLVDSKEFSENLRLLQHWGPDSYQPLWEAINDEHYNIHGLDHTLFERHRLARDFRLLVRSKEAGDSEPIISSYFDSLKLRLSFEREQGFCQRVDEARYHLFDVAVVITHPDHISRTHAYFASTQGYKVKARELDKEIDAKLRKSENETQMNFATVEHDVASMAIPPVVPIVVLAYNTIKNYKI